MCCGDAPRGSNVSPEAFQLVDLIALVFGVAHRDAQQRFRIQKLEKARRERIGGIVDVGGTDSAMRSNEAKFAIGPLRLGAIQRATERLNIGVFQAGGPWGIRGVEWRRGDSQMVMARGAQSFGDLVERLQVSYTPEYAPSERAKMREMAK